MNINTKPDDRQQAKNFEALRRYDRGPVSDDYALIRDVMVPMRDGVRLATDIYLPASGGKPLAGKFPTILDRTPYDKVPRAPKANDPEFAKQLAALADVFPLGLATNGFADTQREKLAATGWEKYFDRVVIAGEVGVFKPDPAFFRLLADMAGAEPGEIIFVGDSPAEDIVPARGAGLTTVWLRTPGAWDPGAHYAISEISEVLNVPPVARWMGDR